MEDRKTMASCFVVMPFGEKEDFDGTIIDFDEVYEEFIKPIVEEELSMDCLRCDEIEEPGWIHSKMFRHIHDADVVIVDITTLNPNVFYELGVRHTLTKNVTVLINRKGTEIPFNISGFNVIQYGTGFKEIRTAIGKIKATIENGLREKKNDSPVHHALEIKVGADPQPIRKKEIYEFELKSTPGKIVGIITGDIRKIKGIDVWVNSENTHMQMARFMERSVSATIRYLGAKKKDNRIVEDTLQQELDASTGGRRIAAGEIVVTNAGELAQTHGVKRIFHAASVSGEIGRGFRPIDNLTQCVYNALDRAEEEDVDIRSIVFPLMGAGTGRGDLEKNARDLIEEAVSYFEENPDCRLDRVYFVAWSKRDRATCLNIMRSNENLKSLT